MPDIIRNRADIKMRVAHADHLDTDLLVLLRSVKIFETSLFSYITILFLLLLSRRSKITVTINCRNRHKEMIKKFDWFKIFEDKIKQINQPINNNIFYSSFIRQITFKQVYHF